MARKGAEHKYDELRAEMRELITHFPHLAGRKAFPTTPGTAALATGAFDLAPRKRNLSAKARKAISDAQKRRWAKVRGSAKG